MVVVAVVGYFGVVVLVVTGDGFSKAGICDCCRSSKVKCIHCFGGICFGGVVVALVVMVGYWW